MKNAFIPTFVMTAVLAFMVTHQTLAQDCFPPCNTGNYCAYDENNNPACFFNCPQDYPCWQDGTCCSGGDNPQGCCPAGQSCDGNGGCYSEDTKTTIKAPSVKLGKKADE